MSYYSLPYLDYTDEYLYTIMNTRGLGEQLNNVSNMEQRTLLPRSEDVIRCSILDFKKEEPDTEQLLARLAELIVKAYFYTKKQSKE